jgi:hypothetical protein
MKSKEEVIKEVYVKLIGEERFNEIESRIDADGWIDFDFLPEDLSLDDFKLKTYTEPDNGFRTTICQPILLKGIDDNFGWISINSEKDLPSENSKVHFIINGYEENEYSGYFDGNLFWNLNQAYTKEIVTHYAPIEKKQPPLHK